MADLRVRIRAGETLIGVFSELFASPMAAELSGRAGFDWTVLDLEHGASTEADLLALLYAVGTTPMAAIVRPQSAERLRVGRALDLGQRRCCKLNSIGWCGRRSMATAIRRPVSGASRLGRGVPAWGHSATLTSRRP